jgi:hypothetical protein
MAEDDEPLGERDSSMSIDFTVSVGYRRRRPNTRGDRWEARIDSIGLLIVGGVVAIVIVIIALPRVLAWLSTL